MLRVMDASREELLAAAESFRRSTPAQFDGDTIAALNAIRDDGFYLSADDLEHGAGDLYFGIIANNAIRELGALLADPDVDSSEIRELTETFTMLREHGYSS